MNYSCCTQADSIIAFVNAVFQPKVSVDRDFDFISYLAFLAGVFEVGECMFSLEAVPFPFGCSLSDVYYLSSVYLTVSSTVC